MSKRLDAADTVIALAADYFHAMLEANEAGLRSVFHPKASIIGNFGEDLEFATLDEFIAATTDAKTGDRPFDYRIDGINLIGDTAVVTVSNYCFATWFTDHLSMVICDGEWRIVAKTFYAHPAAT